MEREYWLKFEQTGKIEDYLKYVEALECKAIKGEISQNGDNSQRNNNKGKSI